MSGSDDRNRQTTNGFTIIRYMEKFPSNSGGEIKKESRLKNILQKVKKFGLPGVGAFLLSQNVAGQELKLTQKDFDEAEKYRIHEDSMFDVEARKAGYQAKDSVDFVEHQKSYEDSSKAHKWGVENLNRKLFGGVSEKRARSLEIPGEFKREGAMSGGEEVPEKNREKFGIRYAGVYDGPNTTEPFFKKPTQPIAPVEKQIFHKKEKEAKARQDKIQKEKERIDALGRMHKHSDNFPWLSEVYTKDATGKYQFDHYEDKETKVHMGTDFLSPTPREKN